MKDLKVSNETHSLLFSLKNKLTLSHNKKFTYDEVIMFLISDTDTSYLPMDVMYQLEEKP